MAVMRTLALLAFLAAPEVAFGQTPGGGFGPGPVPGGGGGGSSELDPGTDYTASGALTTTDTLSIVTCTSTCAMTLAAGTTNGQVHRIKRYGAGTVTVTANIDGTAGATITANSSTLKEMLHLVWSAPKSTWLTSS